MEWKDNRRSRRGIGAAYDAAQSSTNPAAPFGRRTVGNDENDGATSIFAAA
jgi:hypothetical protein